MANYVLGLVAHVNRRVQRARIESSLFPDVTSTDDGTLGVTGNHLAALRECVEQAAAGGAQWIAILEDDALPVAGFHQQLSAALDVAPSKVVSLYNGTGYPAQRQHQFKAATHRQDICWLMHSYLRHAVGYALHRDCVDLGILDTMCRYAAENYAPDDAISKWCMRYSRKVAYLNPSICDHEDGPSVIGVRKHLGIATSAYRRRPRHAHWVGTRLSWNGSILEV